MWCVFLITSTAGELLKIGCCQDWLACVGGCLLVTHQKKKRGGKKERKACPSIMRPLDGLMRLTLNIKTYVSSNILQVVSLQTYWKETLCRYAQSLACRALVGEVFLAISSEVCTACKKTLMFLCIYSQHSTVLLIFSGFQNVWITCAFSFPSIVVALMSPPFFFFFSFVSLQFCHFTNFVKRHCTFSFLPLS